MDGLVNSCSDMTSFSAPHLSRAWIHAKKLNHEDQACGPPYDKCKQSKTLYFAIFQRLEVKLGAYCFKEIENSLITCVLRARVKMASAPQLKILTKILQMFRNHQKDVNSIYMHGRL